MTADPALANLHNRDNKLAEIERAYDEGYAYAEDDFDVDMGWLIAEVKRLRNEGGPCGWCARIRSEECLASAAPHPDDQHRQHGGQD